MATIYPKEEYAFFENSYGILNPKRILEESRKQKYPLDIEAIIKSYAIVICKKDMDYDISGYIEKREKNWIIGVNKYHSKQRQRFTLAHEFAHYVLHSHHIISHQRHEDISLFRSNEFNTMDVEANNFAGELLIPTDKFKEYLRKGTTKIKDLSDIFNVSISAIRYKAYKLGYLNRV